MGTDQVVTQPGSALVNELRQITMILERMEKTIPILMERIATALEAQAGRSSGVRPRWGQNRPGRGKGQEVMRGSGPREQDRRPWPRRGRDVPRRG